MSERPRGGAGSPGVVQAGWYLETAEGGLHRWPINTLPFRIGRRKDLELYLPADSVSKRHAEIYAVGSTLRLRDLGSRNGTFLNRAPVDDDALDEGDVLHFADYEFRLGRCDPAGGVAAGRERPTTVANKGPRPHRFQTGTRELRELIRDEQVTMVFQPIVLLSRPGTIAAYEALGRGFHPQLTDAPLELLHIAETINAEAELSRLFRRKAVELFQQKAPELAIRSTDLPTIFLNTHPIEFSRPGLLESLEELREIAPQLDLALEIHESVLTHPAATAELRRLLLERNIALAYDDFGAREDRRKLLELSDAPPHYLKFDQRYVKGLDQAPASRQRVLRSILAVARELLVKTVAEGIETEAELRTCTDIGFTYGQGFHIGRPLPMEEI